MQISSIDVRRIFQDMQPNDAWSFKDADRKEMNAHTHGYHRYPAKFIPQIVQELIHQFAPNGNEIICDPFGGCGTTLVEAKISGRKSIGFDINPIAKLITQVKVTPIKPKSLENSRNFFMENLKHIKSKNLYHSPRIYYWFDQITIKELDIIYLCILKIKDPKIKKFYLCAFSHILKNSSRWLMKSIKPTIDQNKQIYSPTKSFLRHLDSMIRKNSDFYEELTISGNLDVAAEMYRKDSTKTLPIEACSVDLIITSPPYVTSYEYADLHQLSLLWFGDDLNNFKEWKKFSREFSTFRKQFIGTSHKRSKSLIFGSEIADDVVNKLNEVSAPVALDVANYFSDIRRVFVEMHRILKDGGKACIIVGNTSLKGVEILNAEIAAEQLSGLGFHKVEFFKRAVLNKMITPWRDRVTGKFTGLDNPAKKRVYEYEYVIVMEKDKVCSTSTN